jgi:DNA-binding Xre family transcriptional regulator
LNYGPFIDAAIERSRLSTAEVAQRVGVTDDAVRKWRRGEGVKLSNLEKLADALGCLVGDLLPNSGGRPMDEVFQPVAAAMMGFSKEQIRDSVLLLTSYAGLIAKGLQVGEGVRNFPYLDNTSGSTIQPERDPRQPYGVPGVRLNDGATEPDHARERPHSNSQPTTKRGRR